MHQAFREVTLNTTEQAEQAGFDMSLIDESLRLTHEQRALQHQAALSLALALEEAGRQFREEQDASTGSATGAQSRHAEPNI